MSSERGDPTIEVWFVVLVVCVVSSFVALFVLLYFA